MLNRQNIRVFSKEWFTVWQRALLYLINHKYLGNEIRAALGISTLLPIIGLHQSSYQIYLGSGKCRYVGFNNNIIAKRLRSEYSYIWRQLHRWDKFINAIKLRRLNFGFDTYSGSPDDGTGGDTVHGVSALWGSTSSYTWAQIVDAALGNVKDAGVNNPKLYYSLISGTYYNWRHVQLFDTSPVNNPPSFSNGIMKFYLFDAQPSITNDEQLHVTNCNPESNGNIADEDYGSFGKTSFGYMPKEDMLEWAYCIITLNSDGLNNINEDGISKFGFVFQGDLNYNSPNRSQWVYQISAGASYPIILQFDYEPISEISEYGGVPWENVSELDGLAKSSMDSIYGLKA